MKTVEYIRKKTASDSSTCSKKQNRYSLLKPPSSYWKYLWHFVWFYNLFKTKFLL